FRLVAGVLANLVRHNVVSSEPGPDQAILQRAVACLDAAAEQDTSLNQVINELGLSRTSLFRLFRDHLGTSPGRYLQERRLRRACRLLREGRMEIGAIAAQLGYSSSAAFGAAFKTATGMSPGDYRNSRSVPLGDE
ncbi:MAG: helix-turn-helix domain-containing protein, partial [Planctomycetota bacterium]